MGSCALNGSVIRDSAAVARWRRVAGRDGSRPDWPSSRNWRHAEHGMMLIAPGGPLWGNAKHHDIISPRFNYGQARVG
jgi:hypothetical protein